MITAFTPTNLKSLRAEIAQALSEIEKRHGIKMSLGNISYGATSFSSKLTVETNSNVSIVADKLGLPDDIIDRKFIFNGRTFTVKSLSSKRIKYQVIAVGQDGKNYKFMKSTVLNNLL